MNPLVGKVNLHAVYICDFFVPVYFLHLLEYGIHIGSQAEEGRAVDCGYWHLWRFNPQLADEGKNPFTLDSKAPKWDDFRDFLLGEVRYLSVQKAFPKEADELFTQAEKMAKLRYQTYVRKSQEDWSEQI